MTRVRIDQWLVKHGFAASRTEALTLVEQKRVRKNGFPVSKPSTLISPQDEIEIVSGSQESYVGRGAEKLKSGLTQLDQSVESDWYVDVGASTGGFSDYLLQHGAKGVITIDVGHFQLHQKLRDHPRVVMMEDTHILDVKSMPDQRRVHRAVMDVSFISLRKVLPHVWSLLTTPRWCLMLFKPQFEVGPKLVSKGGVVRDMAVIHQAVDAFKSWVKSELKNIKVKDCLCGVKGKKKGNQEVWILVEEASPKSLRKKNE